MQSGEKFTMHGTQYTIVDIDESTNLVTCEDYNKHYFTFFKIEMVRNALTNN